MLWQWLFKGTLSFMGHYRDPFRWKKKKKKAKTNEKKYPYDGAQSNDVAVGIA